VILLLDTHVFLWWLDDDPRLSLPAREHIADRTSAVYVSAATALETAIKRALGKLDAPADVASAIESNGFAELPISVAHAVASATLPRHHADPFDRLLVAQARLEKMTLVTGDRELARYEVDILEAAV